MAEAREAISQPRSDQRDSFGVARAPLGGQEGHEEQLQGRDHQHRDHATDAEREVMFALQRKLLLTFLATR